MTKNKEIPLSLLYLQRRLKEIQDEVKDIFESKEVNND
jgi:hypothetical protein